MFSYEGGGLVGVEHIFHYDNLSLADMIFTKFAVHVL